MGLEPSLGLFYPQDPTLTRVILGSSDEDDPFLLPIALPTAKPTMAAQSMPPAEKARKVGTLSNFKTLKGPIICLTPFPSQ